MGTILAEVVTMLVIVVGGIVLADRLLWRRYWRRRGFKWSDERHALERLGRMAKSED